MGVHVSAACPQCHILLVEGTSNAVSDLGASAVALVAFGAGSVLGGYDYAGLGYPMSAPPLETPPVETPKDEP